MTTRRDFLKLAAMGGVGSSARTFASAAAAGPVASTGAEDRAVWIALLKKMATPVLSAAASGQLKVRMPVEALDPHSRQPYTHLEAIGRLLAGIAPWLEAKDLGSSEETERARFSAWARSAIDAACDPRSPDYCNFSAGQQPLVDAAFLAQAILRAPRELWDKLPAAVRANLVKCLKSSRIIQPGESNWTLFASTIEAMLHRCGETRDDARLFDGPRKHRKWYAGDGWYGDGAEYHTDYYNSFVIQPMLTAVLDVIGEESAEWRDLRRLEQARLTRYAAIQERAIAPDGSYPVVGRSIAYRCGAFQGLALAAQRHQLPPEVSPGQARTALTSVIRRTLEAPGTFDAHGWLTVGVAGHQPLLGENYISTGSLYLCSVAFLPLGLPAGDPFWSEPAAATTWQKAWSGVNVHADHALAERSQTPLPHGSGGLPL